MTNPSRLHLEGKNARREAQVWVKSERQEKEKNRVEEQYNGRVHEESRYRDSLFPPLSSPKRRMADGARY